MAASTIVNQPYDTSGNGGRKLVRLNNGWLVAAMMSGSGGNMILFYVSKDGGQTWQALCNVGTFFDKGFSIATDGVNIFCLVAHQGHGKIYFSTFNAVTTTNKQYSVVSIVASLQAIDSCSITAVGTEIHATWSDKTSAYANSFNIRYIKGTIDGSGNVTWGSVVQVTKKNAPGIDRKNPSITVKDNIPYIFCDCNEYQVDGGGVGNAYSIVCYANKPGLLNGGSIIETGWTFSNVYVSSSSSYAQSNPCAVIDGNGVIHVAWHGFDSVESARQNIRYSKSTDGGVTWSAMQKLTTGNSYVQLDPSITCDKNNKIFVVWYGADPAISTSWNQIRKIVYSSGSWGSITNLTASTTTGSSTPATLYDKTLDVTDPILIYREGNVVKFRGVWSTNQNPTLSLTSPSDNLVLAEGAMITLEGTISDADPGNVLSVKYSIAGGPTQNIPVGTSDGSTPLAFSKTLTYSQGRFWDGSTDVSGLLPAEASSIQVWANDGIDDSVKATRNFTVVQEDGKLYVPVNVVSTAFLVSRMASPVRLSNGWLVGGVIYVQYAYFYKSQDNGKTWSPLCSLNHGGGAGMVTVLSVASKGTNVYWTFTATNSTQVYAGRFDAATVTNTDQMASRLTVDTGQTAVNGVTSAITPDGTRLWWAASTKNSSLPNSFNIRAGSIPINADGKLGTPSGEVQVTKTNTSGIDEKNPSLTFNTDGAPIIVFEDSSSSGNRIIATKWVGSTFDTTFVFIYSGGTYAQSSPIAIRTPNGKQHVVWHGTDAADTVNPYIRYSNATTGTDWLPTPKKLVKGTNGSITSDKNGKLTITYEDGGYIKRIESSNEFTSYQGPFVVGAGTVLASFCDPTFQTDFSVPPTFFQSTGAVKYYGVLNLNKKPVVTLDTPYNQTLTEQATLAVSGSTLDEDPDNVITTKYKINNGRTRALASGISDGSTPISFARTLKYSGKRMWDGTVDVSGGDLAENVDHLLVMWAEDDKGGKSAEVTRKFRVLWNRPPVIDGENSDLGTIMEIPTIEYSAVDPEGNTFTFSEYLNGKQVRSFAGTAGQSYTVDISQDAWIRLDLDVQHQIKIVATDSAGISSERIYTFTRTETHIEFMLNFENPGVQGHFILDGMPERVLVSLERYIPEGASIESVKVCNNALDEVPTWEDATNAVKGGRGYLFTNTTKTSENWAINLWGTIAKGTATERTRLNGYGGAFD